jgi:hypothetical protein
MKEFQLIKRTHFIYIIDFSMEIHLVIKIHTYKIISTKEFWFTKKRIVVFLFLVGKITVFLLNILKSTVKLMAIS